MADNTIHLLQAAAARHHNAVVAAREAIREFDNEGTQVTFRGVAARAGVSRSWLYRDPDIRAEIERLRSASPPTPKHALPAAQRASTDSLRQRLDTLNDEITRLRKENQILRDQLARQLGQRRTTAT
jgi:TolA-binding protein